MISSGKSQIIRQKKVETCGISKMPTLSLTEPDTEAINSEETSEDTSAMDTEFQYLNILNYSTDTDSQSPNSPTMPIRIPKSPVDDRKSLSSGNSSFNSSNSKALASLLNNGGKLQISTALRERLLRSKSPNAKKLLVSNNSEPSSDQKVGKLSNLSNRLSNQAGSFFSRSCQGEELTNECDPKNGSKSAMNNCGNSQSTKIKSFLTFARTNSKTTSSSPKKTLGSKTSIGGSKSASVDDNDSLHSSKSSSIYSKQNSFSSYEVDFDKLAQELVLPSLNEPLTSFKLIEQNSNKSKPILQTRKTIDVTSGVKKIPISRANTENE